MYQVNFNDVDSPEDLNNFDYTEAGRCGRAVHPGDAQIGRSHQVLAENVFQSWLKTHGVEESREGAETAEDI
jgi:hypothetical protein